MTRPALQSVLFSLKFWQHAARWSETRRGRVWSKVTPTGAKPPSEVCPARNKR